MPLLEYPFSQHSTRDSGTFQAAHFTRENAESITRALHDGGFEVETCVFDGSLTIGQVEIPYGHCVVVQDGLVTSVDVDSVYDIGFRRDTHEDRAKSWIDRDGDVWRWSRREWVANDTLDGYRSLHTVNSHYGPLREATE